MRAIIQIHSRGSWRVRFGPGGVYQRIQWWRRKPDQREQDLGVLGTCVAGVIMSALNLSNIHHHHVDVDLQYEAGTLQVSVQVETEAHTDLIQSVLQTALLKDLLVGELLRDWGTLEFSACARPASTLMV
ncbi:MAG: hypothetical protein JSR66_21375 [Proteobacteria bacterium]|nr:hypothetical protein [Pseudomonadota bacterium]